jgi:hypothetical protein
MAQPFFDEGLGDMSWDEDEAGWVAHPPGLNFRIVVTGAARPDAGLLAHARALAADSKEFLTQVESLLRAFSDRVPGGAPEVLALQVEAVQLPWADRPRDGMVYFSGTDPYRLWRCDYVDRRPQGLVFDD